MMCGLVTIWWQSCRLTKAKLAPCWMTQEKWDWDSIRGRRDSNLNQINSHWSIQVRTCIHSHNHQHYYPHYLASLWKFLVPQLKFSSVQSLYHVRLFATPLYARPACPLPTPGIHPNPCSLGWWCHPTISSSVFPFSSCPQSFPASGSFQMSWLFTSGGQSTGVSASTSVLQWISRTDLL